MLTLFVCRPRPLTQCSGISCPTGSSFLAFDPSVDSLTFETRLKSTKHIVEIKNDHEQMLSGESGQSGSRPTGGEDDEGQFKSISDNPSHPLRAELWQMGSTFSHRFFHPGARQSASSAPGAGGH